MTSPKVLQRTLTFSFHDSGNAGQSDFPLLGIDKAWTKRGLCPLSKKRTVCTKYEWGLSQTSTGWTVSKVCQEQCLSSDLHTCLFRPPQSMNSLPSNSTGSSPALSFAPFEKERSRFSKSAQYFSRGLRESRQRLLHSAHDEEWVAFKKIDSELS